MMRIWIPAKWDYTSQGILACREVNGKLCSVRPNTLKNQWLWAPPGRATMGGGPAEKESASTLN
jgi:hypothetical protein